VPQDAEIVSPGLLAGIDPIQDSQLSRLPHELNLVRLDARVKPPTSSNQSTYNPTVKHDPRQPSLVSSRSLTYRMLTSPRAHASSRPHKRLRLPGPGSLCDGFEVGELRISVPEVKSRMRPRENPVGTYRCIFHTHHGPGFRLALHVPASESFSVLLLQGTRVLA
jgi:hypothetical protein